MIFDQLIFRKIINFVATRCRILRLKFTKFNFGWGSAPDPAGGAYSAPSDPLAGGEGARCPLPKNSTPAFGPSGLALRPFGPQLAAPDFESFRGPWSEWIQVTCTCRWEWCDAMNLVDVREAVETTLASKVLAEAWRLIQVYLMTSRRCWPRHCSSRMWTQCSSERTCGILPRNRSATWT